MGDTANIDFDGYLNGERFDGGKAEGYDLELGSGSFVPGFEEQIVGMKIGEEKDINITFPQDYVADLAGKDVVFKVKLNSLSTKELPELDDEFAKDVSEFDTLDEYKADIRAKQEKQQQEMADNKFRSEIIRKACENMTVDIPAVMIDDKLEEMVRNYAANFGFTDRKTSLEDLLKMMGVDAAAIRPSAEMQVKTELLLERMGIDPARLTVVATIENEETIKRSVASGVGVSTAFLPTGLSGWVSTASTVKPASRRARSGGTEKAGAPA